MVSLAAWSRSLASIRRIGEFVLLLHSRSTTICVCGEPSTAFAGCHEAVLNTGLINSHRDGGSGSDAGGGRDPALKSSRRSLAAISLKESLIACLSGQHHVGDTGCRRQARRSNSGPPLGPSRWRARRAAAAMRWYLVGYG